MDVRDKIFIGGEWVPSKGSGTIEVINSATEEVMGTIPEGSPEDVDLAARAAADAFYGWSTTAVEERAKTLSRISEAIAARTDEIAALITREVGMPLTLSSMIQVGLPMMSFVEHGVAAVAGRVGGDDRKLPHRA